MGGGKKVEGMPEEGRLHAAVEAPIGEKLVVE